MHFSLRVTPEGWEVGRRPRHPRASPHCWSWAETRAQLALSESVWGKQPLTLRGGVVGAKTVGVRPASEGLRRQTRGQEVREAAEDFPRGADLH